MPQNNPVFILQNAQVLNSGGTLKKSSLLIENKKIKILKDRDTLPPNANKINLDGHIIIPGLANSHTHVAMGFFRGLGHGNASTKSSKKTEKKSSKDVSMIESFLFPAEKSLTPELVEALSYSYIVAGIKSGVTCFNDHYYFSESVGNAFKKIGARVALGETVADLGGAFYGEKAGEKSWTNAKKLVENWPFDGDQIFPILAPHAADTVSFDLLKSMANYAKREQLSVHMHLAQTSGENTRVKKRSGKSAVAYAYASGILSPRTFAVHLTRIDHNDLKLLKKSGTTVVVCPSSQMIYDQLAPIESFQKLQLPVCLGTDCAACNDSGDMMRELNLLALMMRDRMRDKFKFDPAEIFATATNNFYETLEKDHELGKIKDGYLADLVVLKSDLACEPHYDFLTNFLMSYQSRHVRHVMVGGKWVLWDQELAQADEKSLSQDYADAIKEINKKVKKSRK